MHPCSAKLAVELSDPDDETLTLSIDLPCQLTREQHLADLALGHAFTFAWPVSEQDRLLLQLDPDLEL